MTEETLRLPCGTGRKGGDAGNGDGRPAGDVPIPSELLEQIGQTNSETLRVAIWMFYREWCLRRPGAISTLRVIAEESGLGVAMTRLVLLVLAEQEWVEETPRGWRLKPIPEEEP